MAADHQEPSNVLAKNRWWFLAAFISLLVILILVLVLRVVVIALVSVGMIVSLVFLSMGWYQYAKWKKERRQSDTYSMEDDE